MGVLGCKKEFFSVDSLRIRPEMLRLVAAIDEFKGACQALGVLASERLSALRRVATIESVASSNRIEGNLLSDKDVWNACWRSCRNCRCVLWSWSVYMGVSP